MSLVPHLPALQVVVPLLAAPLTVLLRRRSVAFAVALAASWVALAIALLLWAIEDIYEPYLLQHGFLDRTPRGRTATRRAYEHLGLPAPDSAAPPQKKLYS